MIRTALLLGAIILPLPPAIAADRSAGTAEGAFARLQRDDARLQTAGWRLATANAPYCRDVRPAAGLLLFDARQFATPAAVRAATGIAGDIAVEAVAEDSPAAAAGLFPGQEVLAIDGAATARPVAAGAAPFARLAALQGRIDAALARNGTVTLTVRNRDGAAREIALAGQPACPVPFTLETASGAALADGTRVIVGQAFGATGSPAEQIDDDEFAAALAHEMAHNLLGHRAWLDKAGRTPENIRRTEREADRLSVWLLANAGYDPATAPRLMRGWAQRRDPGIARVPTHDGWDERARLMEVEIAHLRATLRGTGQADWARDFTREQEAQAPDRTRKKSDA
ncbi:MAG: M48 family metallopeptidase [Novosphingobium sp.]|nr:M48 family metallopeptidase [Novosphingobium sp.]